MYDMFTCFPYVVQTLRICCDVTHDNVYSKLYIYLVKLESSFCFWVICVMIDAEERTGQIYDNFAGTENDHNHVLSTFVDSEHEISNFCHSSAVCWFVQSIFQNNPNESLILTLNIQSVNAKFSHLFPVIGSLTSQVYILEQFVCKRHGRPLIPTCHYCNFLDTNSFTRKVNVLNMVVWWYT